MTILVNRNAMERAFGVFKQSFSLIRRNFSASTTTTEASTPSKKPKRKKKKNLFEVAQFLPNWGVGYQMAKTHWIGVSYQITKINLYKDGKHGKAWGIVHKEGFFFFLIIRLPFYKFASCPGNTSPPRQATVLDQELIMQLSLRQTCLSQHTLLSLK
ncbi:hypothetical protein IFM89_013312 [Coptis chinensis]|uniref:Uncharacterized protein n=1 Tax=Coptis chinensis TaxID=261450 RepID=A0A835HAI8_9MAGN|nr:hypothetical protein IFM89_013312 [Coptis chinensis]